MFYGVFFYILLLDEVHSLVSSDEGLVFFSSFRLSRYLHCLGEGKIFFRL